MIISFEQIFQWLMSFFLPLVRITSFFIAVPLIGTQLVSQRIRLVLGLSFTLFILPVIDVPDFSSLSLGQLFVTLIQQLAIGLTLGFCLQLLFHIGAIAGQIIAMQNGLGFSILVDPLNGVNTASIGQMYLLLTNLLFLSMNGHLVLIRILSDSFNFVPIGVEMISKDWFFELVKMGSWMFASALLIALPAVTALLIANLAFGLMTRVAPQFNIFSIGFPFIMIFGLVVVLLTFSAFETQFVQFTETALDTIYEILQT